MSDAESRRTTRFGLPPAATWIARRYLFARRHGYAAFVNWVSFAGLALGVTILTVVVSVMNGFDRELVGRLLSASPHVVVRGVGELPDEVVAMPEVLAAGRHYRGEGLLQHQYGSTALTVLGVDAAGAGALAHITDQGGTPALRRLFGAPARPSGAWEGETPSPHGNASLEVSASPHRTTALKATILVGDRLAQTFGLRVGDPVVLTMASAQGGGIRPRMERFVLAGTFDVGAEPDSTVAMVRYDDARARGLAAHGIAGWRLFVEEPLAAPALVPQLASRLPAGASITSWADQYGGLFRAVKIEKAMMFVLLLLIVALAAFNVVSCQAMLVHEKRADAAILSTMGASRGFLATVFFLQGAAVATAGVGSGLALGVVTALHADAAIAAVEGLLGASIIEGTYFHSIPSDVQIGDLALIATLSLGLCAAALLRPALRITAEDPADALHSP